MCRACPLDAQWMLVAFQNIVLQEVLWSLHCLDGLQGPTFAGGPVGFLTFPECEIVDHYKKGRYSFLNSHFCDGWEVSGGGQGCIIFAGSRWLPSQVPQLTSGYPAPTFTLHSPLYNLTSAPTHF